jgi:hypothetical protein
MTIHRRKLKTKKSPARSRAFDARADLVRAALLCRC